ncbi:MAG: helix-turn-helix domain-containing protein, partial [Anaerolineales bacterium]
MNTQPVSPPDIPTLLAQGMGEGLHWFPEKVSSTRLAETMVGMANAEGGIILLGVAPRAGRVQGVENIAALLDRIFQAALLTDPPLVLPMPEVYTTGRAQVAQLTVPPGLPHVYSLNGRYLGRDGCHTSPLPARKLRQLLLERGIVHFESQLPPNTSFDDLDPGQVENYLRTLNLPSEESPEDVLLRRGCLKPFDGGGVRPTYAALLLFGRHPQR